MAPAARSSLGRQMGRAAVWSSVNSIVLRLGTFAVGIVAARLVAPREFGVFAVALTVHAIIVNASDVGVSAYIVRRRGDIDDVGPTVTTIALASATLLAIAMALGAPWLATQLGSAAATGPVRLLSLTVLLAGIGSVPGAVLTREFRQDRKFVADLAYFVASTAVLLVLAVMGGGALALAWSRVAGQLISTVALIAASPRKYRPGLDRTVLGSVLSFGLPLIGASFLGFLIGNVDYIVIGRLLGAGQLGLYYLAYNIGSWPYVILSPVIASVSMAAFSRVRDDRRRLAGRISTAMATLVMIALPASALIVALSRPLVQVVYGGRWAGAVAALSLTAVYGALRVPADLLANVAIAEGRTRAMLYTQIAYLAALAPLTVAGVKVWGIAGAGLAHIVGNTCVLLPGLVLVLARRTGYGPRRLLASTARPMIAAVAAGISAHLIAVHAGDGWVALLSGAAGGVAVYVLAVATWARRLLISARKLWSGDSPTSDADAAAPERPLLLTPAPEAVGA